MSNLQVVMKPFPKPAAIYVKVFSEFRARSLALYYLLQLHDFVG